MLLLRTTLAVSLLLCSGHMNAQTNYYADCYNGDDDWDGMYPTYSWPNHGPKKTIQAAVWLAHSADTVNFTSGPYFGVVEISKDIILVGSSFPNISNLKLKDTCSVTLRSDLLVWGNLTIESGRLNTGSSSVFVWNSDPDAVVIKSGYIDGEVTRRIACGATDSYAFTDKYTTFAPDGNQGSMQLRIRSFPGITPPSISGGNSIYRYYTITSSTGVNGELCLAYDESELGGIPEDNLAMFGFVGSIWTNQGGSVDENENYIHKTNAVLTPSSMWTLGDLDNPLPIQLTHFSASVIANSNTVRLVWGTLSETNNYGFFVQRRAAPATEYTELPNSFVPGHGTTGEPHEYSWAEYGVAPGTYYYRLKQVDLDGTIHFTEAREVTVLSLTGMRDADVPTEFTLSQNYPNPFNPSTEIRFTVEKAGLTTLTVFDILGKEMRTLFAEVAEPGKMYSVNFDAATLTNGTYFYKLVGNGKATIRKMLLLK